MDAVGRASVPVPEFVTVTGCEAGFVPPCVAENVSGTAESAIVGCDVEPML